jgi:2-hydroxy-3-oxopropionate reductase
MKIGYIGLGLMGRPCAMHLLDAGHQLTLYARRQSTLLPFESTNSTLCMTPADVAAETEIVFVNVSDTPDVEQVVLGKDGIIDAARPGSIVIDMSTISPLKTGEIAAQLKLRDIHMLDAPVSGGTTGAKSATLSIMVGGDKPVFERILPLFELMGSNIVHIGGNGAGQLAKACNQIIITQTITAVAEAFCLADAMSIDKSKIREALLGGFANSRILEQHGQNMIDEDYTPGFKAGLHHKDMAMVLQTAGVLGIALPGTAISAQWLNVLVGQGDAELDSSALYKVIKKLNSIKKQ